MGSDERAAVRRLLDWHLRSVTRREGMPDLPEIRAWARACWVRGFTFGALPGPEKMRDLRAAALLAWADLARREGFRDEWLRGI